MWTTGMGYRVKLTEGPKVVEERFVRAKARAVERAQQWVTQAGRGATVTKAVGPDKGAVVGQWRWEPTVGQMERRFDRERW